MSDSDGPLHSPRRKTTTASDDLTSVTVRKDTLNEKSGIFLVERQGVVYVTKITENGLFHNTDIDVGDVILSINGRRLKKGEGAGDFTKAITQAKATVTVVVKKYGKKSTIGARSLSPRNLRKKKNGERLHKAMARRNPDGSFDPHHNPIVLACKSDDDEEVFEQYNITATKIFVNQAVGLTFLREDNMLFVSNIALDSIFRDTELEVGDRVCLINKMNFMTYADGGYAKTVISKATSKVEIVVEKGHETDLAKENVKVPRIAFNPLSPRAFTSPTKVKPKVEISSDSSEVESSEVEISDDSSEESGDRKPPPGANRGGSNVDRDTSFESPKKMKDLPKLMEIPFTSPTSRDTSSSESPKKIKYLPKLMESPLKSTMKPKVIDEDYGHDFIRVTVKKISDRKSGVSLMKTEGKFILTAVPNYEKRISVGDEVLAINGTRNINTVVKADDLINRSKGSVVLIVNFDCPKDFECPCCGEPMTCKGKHI